MLCVDSAISNISKSEKTVTIPVESYGDVQFSVKVVCHESQLIHRVYLQMGSIAESLLVPSERMSRLEETASYRRTVKDAQDEVRSFYDFLLKKQMRGITLGAEEKRAMLIAEQWLQIPLTLGESNAVVMWINLNVPVVLSCRKKTVKRQSVMV